MKAKLGVLLTTLGMIGILLGCSGNTVQTEQKETQESEEQTLAGATRNISEEAADYSDEAFLNALGKGLMNRWDYNANKNSNSTFGSEQDKIELQECIDLELNEIEQYKDAKFKDQDLQALAVSYIDTVGKQAALVADYPDKNDFVNNFNTQSKKRAEVLTQLLENYTVPIDDEYDDIVAEFADVAKANEEELKNKPGIIVIGATSSQSDGYVKIGVTLKNALDRIICTPTIYVSFLDENGDIVKVVDLQAMVTVFPGQCITLDTYTEVENAESFSVNDEGSVYFANEPYKAIIGGHLDPVSLDNVTEEYEECEKSPINCIDEDVDNKINSTDIGISIEDMYIEEMEGGFAKCYAKIKNNTSSTIDTPTLHAALMDHSGNIIRWDMMQEMVKVNPDQAITLSCFVEAEDLEYFTVTYASYRTEDDYKSGYLSTIPKAAER